MNKSYYQLSDPETNKSVGVISRNGNLFHSGKYIKAINDYYKRNNINRQCISVVIVTGRSEKSFFIKAFEQDGILLTFTAQETFLYI